MADDPDMIVLGLQEVDLRSTSLLIAQTDGRAEAWETNLFLSLADKAPEWERVELSQYVGVVLIILAKKSLKGYIGDVGKSARGVGLMGFGVGIIVAHEFSRRGS